MRLIVALISLTFAFPALGEDFYKIGKDALNKNDYVTALKYLFAYRTLKREELLRHPEFLADLDKSISTAELFLRDTQEKTVSGGTGVTGVASVPNRNTGVYTRGYQLPEMLKELDSKGLKVVPQNSDGRKFLEETIKTQERQLQELKKATQLSEDNKSLSKGIQGEMLRKSP